MAGHDLIDAYLAGLTGLPADTIDELADGLVETYERHRSAGLAPDAAAAAAIREFGSPERVMGEFVRQSPARRTALTLLGTGPIVGLCWATTLVMGHAWTWPVPAVLRVGAGAALVAIVVSLVVAATARTSLRRTRLAAGAGLGLIALDASIVSGLLLIAPPLIWPMIPAVAASLTRITLTARAIPRLLR